MQRVANCDTAVFGVQHQHHRSCFVFILSSFLFSSLSLSSFPLPRCNRRSAEINTARNPRPPLPLPICPHPQFASACFREHATLMQPCQMRVTRNLPNASFAKCCCDCPNNAFPFLRLRLRLQPARIRHFMSQVTQESGQGQYR